MNEAVHTPWGPSESVSILGPGVEFHTTATHGGIRLSPECNARIPHPLRENTTNQDGLQGWYEEDRDWALVAVEFPECFASGVRRRATRIVQDALGLTIDPDRPFPRFSDTRAQVDVPAAAAAL